MMLWFILMKKATSEEKIRSHTIYRSIFIYIHSPNVAIAFLSPSNQRGSFYSIFISIFLSFFVMYRKWEEKEKELDEEGGVRRWVKRMKAKLMKGFVLYYVIKINGIIKNVIFIGNFLICYRTRVRAFIECWIFTQSHFFIIYNFFW